MKQGKWWVCGLAALLLLGWSYTAAQEGAEGRAKRGKGQRQGERGRGAGGERGGRGGSEASFDYAGIAAEMKLSGEQAEKLTGLILNQLMLVRAQRFQLNADQKTQLKDACMAAAKDVLGAADARERGKAVRGVDQKLRSEILTDEQRKKAGGGREGRGGAKREGGREGRAKKRGDQAQP